MGEARQSDQVLQITGIGREEEEEEEVGREENGVTQVQDNAGVQYQVKSNITTGLGQFTHCPQYRHINRDTLCLSIVIELQKSKTGIMETMLRRELAVIKLNSFTSFLVFTNIDINVSIKKNDTLTMRRRGGGFSSKLEKRTLVFSILQFILGTITNIY